MAEIEKFACNRYRLRAHGHMITLSAQDLLDIDNWLRQHAENLRLEAQDAQDEEDEEADGENFLYSQYI